MWLERAAISQGSGFNTENDGFLYSILSRSRLESASHLQVLNSLFLVRMILVYVFTVLWLHIY